MGMRVVEVKYPDNDLIESVDAGGHNIARGDYIIVDTRQGERWGKAVSAPLEFEIGCGGRKLARVNRVADDKDLRKIQSLESKAGESRRICAEKVEKHKLPMKIIGVDMALDGGKITFHFTAENRVDFRELVKDLAGVFRTRIELHQVGVRDEARIFGGIGPCGCRLCCTSFIRDFEPVSIKMAKEQNLPLNPMKISGLCGRLLCCLRYEHQNYHQCRRGLPKPGQTFVNNEGKRLRVVHVNILERKVVFEEEDGSKTEIEYGDGKPPDFLKLEPRKGN